MQNARVAAFIVSELLRENQQVRNELSIWMTNKLGLGKS